MNQDFLNKIKLPAVLASILILPMLFGEIIPVEVKSYSYALSLSMKSILEFLLPFIIFSFIFSCLANQQKGAVMFVFLLIACVFASNFTALMIGYGSGNIGLSILNIHGTPSSEVSHLQPAWTFVLKKLISNDKALLIGFVLGIYFSLMPNEKVKRVANKLNLYSNTFLKQVFIPLLPIFIAGFIFKLEHDNVLQASLKIYGPVLLLILVTQWLYLMIWYGIASSFKIKKMCHYIRNVLPATLTGLSTISSAASMPVLLMSTEKNLDDPERARMLVPAVINIHTVGSAIGVPILTLATLVSFGNPIPSLASFAVFAFYTALAKYAVAAVPGGVIIVVAPLLETYLGFSSDMIGLITAVYLICDPFGTCANVTGNGVFPILFTRLYTKLSKEVIDTKPSVCPIKNSV